jgi:hypothetical protein
MTSKLSPEPEPLLDAAGVEGLIQRALEHLAYEAEVQESRLAERDRKRNPNRWAAAIAALHFGIEQAEALGDLGLVPRVIMALEEISFWNHDPIWPLQRATSSITTLLARGARLTAATRPGLEWMAGADEPAVRTTVAAGLAPAGAEEIALLRRLAQDPVPEVRKAAREQLASVAPPAWWLGKFSTDPEARLLPEELARIRPTLTELSRLLDLPEHERTKDGGAGQLGKLADQLPDSLVLDLGRTLLARTSGRWHDRGQDWLLLRVLLRPGGSGCFLELLRIWAGDELQRFAAAQRSVNAFTAVPKARRLEVLADLLAVLAASSADEQLDYQSFPCWVAGIVAKAWPERTPVDPVVELVLAAAPPPAERHAHNGMAYQLHEAFEVKGATIASKELLERVIVHLRSARDRLHSALATALDGLVRKGIPKRRWRQLCHEVLADARATSGALAWAMGEVTGLAHDARKDPPVAELMRGFVADPRYRGAILAHFALVPRALPHLRPLLAGGQLPADGARFVVQWIDSLFGGAVSPPFTFGARRGGSREKERKKQVAEYEAFLGGPEQRGPISDEEWRGYRVSRGPVKADTKNAQMLLDYLAPGPWDPEDWSFVMQFLELARSDDWWAMHVGGALAAKPCAAALPLIDELLERWVDSEWGRELEYHRTIIGNALGLSAPASAAPPAARPTEWMDELDPLDDDD